MQPLCWVIGTFLLSALLPWPSTGEFTVIGPKTPIIVLAGEDVVLSCHLDPEMNAQNMEVKWYRNHSSGLVHHYGAFQDHTEQQMPEYQGRTVFLKENITKGQAALRIHSVRPFDDGVYRCFFESSTFYTDAIIEVLVTGSGLAPHIHIEPGNTREVKLTCTSTDWYPEPEVQWRDLQGQRLVPDSETKTREENGLFRVETSLTADKSSGGAVSCLIKNPVLNEEKAVRISVADALILRNYPWKVALAVILSLLVVVSTFSVVYVVRSKKAKGRLKEKYEEVKEGKDYLLREKEEQKEYIKEQEENLAKEKQAITEQKEYLERENRYIKSYSGYLQKKSENLEQEKQNLAKEKQEIKEQREHLEKEKEESAYDEHRNDLGVTAVALYDYQAAEDEALSFDPDDVITNIEMLDQGWWWGTCRGSYGLFPAHYVELRQ